MLKTTADNKGKEQGIVKKEDLLQHPQQGAKDTNKKHNKGSEKKR